MDYDYEQTEMSWRGSESSMTASTASLQQQQHRSTTPSRAGPGLLLFPGTAQRQGPEQALANLMSQSQRRKTTNAKAANANEEHVVINQRKPNSVRSFRRPPLWQRCVPDRSAASSTSLEEPPLELDEAAVAACVGKAQAFIIEFLLGSSIHGFIYLAKRGLNFVER